MALAGDSRGVVFALAVSLRSLSEHHGDPKLAGADKQ